MAVSKHQTCLCKKMKKTIRVLLPHTVRARRGRWNEHPAVLKAPDNKQIITTLRFIHLQKASLLTVVLHQCSDISTPCAPWQQRRGLFGADSMFQNIFFLTAHFVMILCSARHGDRKSLRFQEQWYWEWNWASITGYIPAADFNTY